MTYILQAGIFAKASMPPAVPISLEAHPGPTNADKLGAMYCILL